jgi:hypothetical protein
VKRKAVYGNCLFRGLAMLLKNVRLNLYFVLRHLIADAETVLCYAEYSH